LEREIAESGVELSPEERGFPPTQLALRVFNRLKGG
jgi:hypothetical protein